MDSLHYVALVVGGSVTSIHYRQGLNQIKYEYRIARTYSILLAKLFCFLFAAALLVTCRMRGDIPPCGLDGTKPRGQQTTDLGLNSGSEEHCCEGGKDREV